MSGGSVSLKVLFLVWSSYPKEKIYADPSVWYRCFQPAAALRRLGVQCAVVRFDELRRDEITGYDVVIFFRPQFSTLFTEIFYAVEETGAVCVASYDDLFFDIHLLRQSNFRNLDVKQTAILASRPYNYAQALYFFDHFIVSTEPMGEFFVRNHPDSKVHVLFNAIAPDTQALAYAATVEGKVERVPRRIGYFAGGRSHSGDILRISRDLADVLVREDATFFCVNTVEVPAIIAKTGRVEVAPRFTFAGMILAYATCSVTIAPLEMDEFAMAKSGIKYLEASVVGAATVATPIPDIVRVGDDRLFTALETEDWSSQLAHALAAPISKEITLGQQERLRRNFSTEVEARRLLEYFMRVGRTADEGVSAEDVLA